MLININFSYRSLQYVSAAALLSALLLFLFYFMQWQQDWQLSHPTRTNPLQIKRTAETNDLIAAIPAAHLFGKAVEKKDVPLTSLQVHVTGIVKSMQKNLGLSKAYLSINGQPSKVYQTGDHLPYGVKIYDITDFAVIVENNGQLEKILLPREKLHFRKGLN